VLVAGLPSASYHSEDMEDEDVGDVSNKFEKSSALERTFPGLFRSLLICSLCRASSPSSFRILTSIEPIRVSVYPHMMPEIAYNVNFRSR